MLTKTYTMMPEGEGLRPLFRTPIGLFENMLSDVDGF
jgi:hypothetical protein